VRLFVIVLLVFPSSSSVLCIAPGSHVAIEDINSLCCVSSDISRPSGSQPHNELSGPSSCNNCTDLFLASNGREVLPQSGNLSAAGQVDEVCLETCLSADISVSLRRSDKIGSAYSPVPVCSSVPLRC